MAELEAIIATATREAEVQWVRIGIFRGMKRVCDLVDCFDSLVDLGLLDVDNCDFEAEIAIPNTWNAVSQTPQASGSN